jgi:hypothetical protein
MDNIGVGVNIINISRRKSFNLHHEKIMRREEGESDGILELMKVRVYKY